VKGRQIALVGGGVRSGKSAFALELARSLGRRRAFVATAEARDDEMRERVARHRQERGAEFETVEAPVELSGALRSLGGTGTDVVVVDCLTFWLSNLLLAGAAQQEIARQVEGLAETLAAAPFHSVLVTNEVGMGVVPESALGRAFRDVTGRAHQALSARADRIYFAALGTILRLKPGPVELARPSGDLA
jgi:adenosylcobinamide kinase/adenosylcobinamide-phosphate guanylyltransferase